MYADYCICTEYGAISPTCTQILLASSMKMTLALILRWRRDRQLRRGFFFQRHRRFEATDHRLIPGDVDPVPRRGGSEALPVHGVSASTEHGERSAVALDSKVGNGDKRHCRGFVCVSSVSRMLLCQTTA